MEHQAGAGWTGSDGENAARDGDSNRRERALADAADSTGRAKADQAADSSAAQPDDKLPAAPELTDAPGLPATGEPRVDAALKLLDRLPGLPVSDHPELFEQVHAQLSEVLGELDSGAGAVGLDAG